MSRVVVITGTGTEIGKTHAAEALLLALATHGRILGYKPIESGVTGDEGDDGRRLRLASTFHVKPPPPRYLLKAPVSPHLAARADGLAIDPTVIATAVRDLATQVDVLVVELAGGLFSPVTDSLLNIDLLRILPLADLLLIAPDRLGVIHEVIATTRAAAILDIRFAGIILSAPAQPDASTDANAAELERFVALPVLATLPRAPARTLAASGTMNRVVARILQP